MSVSQLNTQNALLLSNLMEFYENQDNTNTLYRLINGEPITTAKGESVISLRIIDWFVTNYAKMYDTIYMLPETPRFRVYNAYKLELKAYSKRRFDPFARVEFQEQYTRKKSAGNKPKMVSLLGDDGKFSTTIGQMNFFKWAIENRILEYIVENYDAIERDMNERGSNSSRNAGVLTTDEKKHRKKREELSVSAYKCIKKEISSATFSPTLEIGAC